MSVFILTHTVLSSYFTSICSVKIIRMPPKGSKSYSTWKRPPSELLHSQKRHTATETRITPLILSRHISLILCFKRQSYSTGFGFRTIVQSTSGILIRLSLSFENSLRGGWLHVSQYAPSEMLCA